jgi:anti-sigma B factor antagonist
MMAETAAKSVYLVDAYSDPVVVRIDGRACFQNSACLRDFVTEMLRQGKSRFVIDFQHCSSMDSTFLGVLAGIALELKRSGRPSSFVVTRVGQRNLELMRNLGLHRLLSIDGGEMRVGFDTAGRQLTCPDRSEVENARLVLEAHENLVAADEANRAKFQDVLSFLRTRVEQKQQS